MVQTTHENLIDTLIQFEMSMASLYITFGKIFPAVSGRWADFAEEECRHARWLAELSILLRDERISSRDSTITILTASRGIHFAERQIIRAFIGEVDLHEAITIALVVENSALESSFLNIFTFKNREAEKIRQKLVTETRSHREKFILWLDRVENERGQTPLPSLAQEVQHRFSPHRRTDTGTRSPGTMQYGQVPAAIN